MKLSIYYRGSLASCNYACNYCPFSKRRDTRKQLSRDRVALQRFVGWAKDASSYHLGILFTPWGEALIRPAYQNAMIELSQCAHVWKVAIQTNLSCSLKWIDACRIDHIGLWSTFHPTEVPVSRFVKKVHWLRERGVSISVGVVGKREHFSVIKKLREQLPGDVYLWINAYKGPGGGYEANELKQLSAIDPLLPIDYERHHSKERACSAGEASIAVDATGAMRRCHFVEAPIGNIYQEGWNAAFIPRLCPNADCNCFLGYSQLTHLAVGERFGDGILERNGERWLEKFANR